MAATRLQTSSQAPEASPANFDHFAARSAWFWWSYILRPTAALYNAISERPLCATSSHSITAQYANPLLSYLVRYLGHTRAELETEFPLNFHLSLWWRISCVRANEALPLRAEDRRRSEEGWQNRRIGSGRPLPLFPTRPKSAIFPPIIRLNSET